MTTVAFENLDVVAGVAPPTTTDWSIPKIVDRRRGGWCYEINSTFGALVEEIGFEVAYHSARVHDPATHETGPPLDHLCLVVTVEGRRHLVDAGFGDSSVSPVALDDPGDQNRLPCRARVEHRPEGWAYLEWMHGDHWELQYLIDPEPVELSVFQRRSDQLSAGAGSGHFTEKPFATRALDHRGDRVWLLRDRLELRRGDGHQGRTATPVTDWDAVLVEWFGMEAPAAVLDRMRDP
jgi:N-hydroxyarylamine O-acetyltransferase